MEDCGGVTIKFPTAESKSDKVRGRKKKRTFFDQINILCLKSTDCYRIFAKYIRVRVQVSIRGPKDDVEKAKLQLMELTNEKQLSSFSAEVRAKVQHHKFLIGKNGANIKKV